MFVEKKYWKKGEIAKELKVLYSTIGYWESYFQNYFSVKRSSTNKRMYTLEDLQLFKLIYQLAKVEKYTLEGVKDKLKYLI